MHVPLERKGKYPTYHLCGDEFFDRLKKRVVFINSSRGEVVDTAALKRAITGKKLLKTAVDVWENEPQIDEELLEISDIATAHIAGYSLDGKANGTIAVVRAVAEKLGIEQLKNWDCKGDVPMPEQGTDIVVPEGICGVDAVKYAVKHAYDVLYDTAVLKADVSKFEELRGNYYVRREFPLFSVKTADADSARVLEALGFKIV